ncbi:constitutive coactivator of PPAR-gamma-like protein 1 isoform X2 [Amphibalanus amphitrite]|uniref:constitutive coactivator of PPAR-gamma-like protein 1 isoform X2 n=1 Tax=Amphibalanus amphitrite TaxID=1232801 RepID=UPI001C91E21C|nr:constitutive coactivator of PPAR-gamma-like protein 1 isoform X2 [Amphibalanus amphitrite]
MGIQDLQRYIEAHVPGACVPVDLLKIARGVTLHRPRTPGSRHRPPAAVELCLVLDAEGCLDRLYGGYFSDWVCGGQWNRMVQFLSILVQTVQNNNMELAVYFSGALELPRMREWVGRQYNQRRDINQALKHVALKATPPPKVWWTAPACLRTALRMALRHLKVQVLCSVEDHRQEVMAFCRENNYHGVMAEDAEYLLLGPPRYFSAKQMKLTYKGSLETKEFILNEVARGLDLQPNRFCLLAALLGNYQLTEEELAEFHGRLASRAGHAKATPEEVTGLVVEFVRTLASADDLDEVGTLVFQSATDPRVAKLRASVRYYTDASRDDLKYKPAGGAARAATKPADAADPAATETRRLYDRAAGGSQDGRTTVNGVLAQQMSRLSTDDGAAPGSFTGGSASNGHVDGPEDGPQVNLEPPPLPSVTPEVLRTAAERHQKGLMAPWVYQVLSQGELQLPVCVEDELGRELPNSALFYRPVRERVYAVLFNLYHHSFLHNRDKDKPAEEQHQIPTVQVREWAYSRANPYTRPDLVTAQPLNWGVPTVQRLWFGTTDDDKKRRMRALLSCVNADSPYIRNPLYVPQHLLVLACVLRYMMSQTGPNGQAFLCKPELDAFIAQALSPKLTDSQYLQDLQLPSLSARAVQLASLFMQGVETVLFANDACGAPIPWLMCCPWLFFDGKLFHSFLLKATQCRNVLELCDNQLDMVGQLDLVRQAVLDGLHVQYARPQLSGHPAGHPPLVPGPRRLLARGGRLQIGGVVVGSWAGNSSLGGRGRAPAGGAPRRGPGGGVGQQSARDGWPAAGRAAKTVKKKAVSPAKKEGSAGRGLDAGPDASAAGSGAGDPGSAGGGAAAPAQFEDALLLVAQ